jgi:hypothetical protein
MGDLRPLGSERLDGTDKIRRIMEIARYNEVEPKSINENSSLEYTIQLADGNYYGIVREKSGYIVKKGLTESEMDYSEPMKNRKYHKSFSQAMKKINLIAGELNRLHENETGISLIGEQKKFVLKTPKPEVAPEAPVADTAETPPMDLGSMDSGSEEIDLGDMGDMGDTSSDETSLDFSVDTPSEDKSLSLDMTDGGGDEDEVSFKSIQKLTGKLGQKIRTLDGQQGMSSEDIKYVLNSILSALDLSKLTEEDYDDVMSKFEDAEDNIDYGVDDETELNVDLGDDLDLTADLETEPEATEGEMTEDSDFDLATMPSMDFEMDQVEISPEDIKSELHSTIDQVLSKYFAPSEEETQMMEQKKVKNYLKAKVKQSNLTEQVQILSETVEQEMTATFILKEHGNVKFLGKTNKNNLVFEADNVQLKITTKGEII